MDKVRYSFDFVTQRFIVSRWETELGRKVRDEVIWGLKHSVIVREILNPYIKEHSENVEPYGYPYYPKDQMTANAFWVITGDDLRGIKLYGEDFSGSSSFEGKDFTYGWFADCNLSNVVIAARKSGKIKAVAQSTAINLIILVIVYRGFVEPKADTVGIQSVNYYLMLGATLVTLFSAFDYILGNWNIISKYKK